MTAGGSVAAASVGDKRSVGLAVGAMCMFGVIGLFYKLGLGMGAKPAMMTAMQSVGVFCMAVPFALIQKDPLPRRGVPPLAPLRVRGAHLIELCGHRRGIHLRRSGRRGAHRPVEVSC